MRIVTPKVLTDEILGFFDPKAGESGETCPVINTGRYTYYRDIFNFIDRIRDCEETHREEQVLNVIYSSLHGAAHIWVTIKLSPTKKTLLRAANLDGWEAVLIIGFKEHTSKALIKMTAENYSLQDTADGKSPKSYIHDVLQHAHNANFTSVHHQLTLTWNSFAVEFHRNLPEPNPSTTLSQFITAYNSRASV